MAAGKRLRTYAVCGVLLMGAILAAWLRGAHRPFEYMVAGTLATAVLLLAAFVLLVKRKVL
ncbi:MAG TPA: hypothetical protein VGH38_34555 [Bryobacteraceae bacterium]|jgi:hypothetical protein